MKDKLYSLLSYGVSLFYGFFGAYSLQDWMSILGGVCVVATVFINRNHKKKILEEIRKRPISEDMYEKIS